MLFRSLWFTPFGQPTRRLTRGGRMVAAGPLEEVLTSDTISATFGLPVEVQRHGQRWSARAL